MQWGILTNSERPILSLGGSAVRPRWHRQQTVTFGAWQGLYGVGEKAVKPHWPGAGCPVSGVRCPKPDNRYPTGAQPTDWNFLPSKR